MSVVAAAAPSARADAEKKAARQAWRHRGRAQAPPGREEGRRRRPAQGRPQGRHHRRQQRRGGRVREDGTTCRRPRPSFAAPSPSRPRSRRHPAPKPAPKAPGCRRGRPARSRSPGPRRPGQPTPRVCSATTPTSTTATLSRRLDRHRRDLVRQRRYQGPPKGQSAADASHRRRRERQSGPRAPGWRGRPQDVSDPLRIARLAQAGLDKLTLIRGQDPAHLTRPGRAAAAGTEAPPSSTGTLSGGQRRLNLADEQSASSASSVEAMDARRFAQPSSSRADVGRACWDDLLRPDDLDERSVFYEDHLPGLGDRFQRAGRRSSPTGSSTTSRRRRGPPPSACSPPVRPGQVLDQLSFVAVESIQRPRWRAARSGKHVAALGSGCPPPDVEAVEAAMVDLVVAEPGIGLDERSSARSRRSAPSRTELLAGLGDRVADALVEHGAFTLFYPDRTVHPATLAAGIVLTIASPRRSGTRRWWTSTSTCRRSLGEQVVVLDDGRFVVVGSAGTGTAACTAPRVARRVTAGDLVAMRLELPDDDPRPRPRRSGCRARARAGGAAPRGGARAGWRRHRGPGGPPARGP